MVLRWPPAGTHKKNIRITRALLFVVVLLLSAVNRMNALDPSQRISQYGHTAWRIQDGYFAGNANAITQTADGYIWVGTAAGLFRFDGVQFVPWASLTGEQTPSNNVHSLCGARDGSLWIGTASGLAHWVNQHSIRYLDGEVVNGITQDEKGQIWAVGTRPGGNTHPLCRILDTDVHCYGEDEGVILSSGDSVAEDSSGNLWVGADTALLRWKPGSSPSSSSMVYRPAALQSNQGLDGVVALAAAADGSVWIGMAQPGRGGGLQRMANSVLKPFVTPNLNGETQSIAAILIDRQGDLWVGTTSHGVYRIRGTEVDHFGTGDGLSSDGVSRLFEDREGNLWVATSKGIDMLSDLRVNTISGREGLSEETIESVLAALDGTVWIGSDHLQALTRNGISSELGKGLPGNQVTSLFEDHAGRLWVGVENSLWVYDSRKFTSIKRKDGRAFGMVMGMAEDSDHNLWVESRGPPATLIRIQDLKTQEEFPSPPMPVGRKLALDPQSGVWMSLNSGDLARFRSGKAEIFPFPNHPNTRVKALFAAPDGSILGGTEFGVVGWKAGKQQILTVRNGLPCNDINGLITDDRGALWLYAGCGLIEIEKDEVQRWWEKPDGKLKMRVFDTLDGVQPGIGHFNTSAKTPDGRLWFANGSVLQVIDPAHITGNPVPPPVHINSVVADRKSYSTQEALRLPALTRNLEIDYTALSFTAAKKVLFRYMLEGRDSGWQDPGTRRQAFYNDLRPRRYRFRVIACNNDGVWNEAGATLDFSIAPAYYQTWWFRVACAAAFLAVLWTLYQLRLRQIQRQFHAAIETRENERTRIAGELHDTLLQSFQGAVFQFQAARRLVLRNADNAKQVMDEAIQAAEEGITEGRAAIHDLRRESAAQRDLPELLKAAVMELAETHRSNGNVPTFSIIAEGRQRILPLVTLDEIYQISREILRNAFTHAGASHIEVEIRYDAHQLRVRIRDDGKGVDPKILQAGGKSGHYGIPGMRERAERIGARLDFWSEMGAGTEVQLTIPASMAYTKRPDRRRFRFSRRTGSVE